MTREHQEQAALIEWRDWMTPRYPALQWLFAIPNGGKRDKITAARLKAEGVQPGVPDLFLPVVGRTGGAGLWIEMKTNTGRLSLDQQRWRDHLVDHYDYALCRNWIDAARVICTYLGIDPTSAGIAAQNGAEAAFCGNARDSRRREVAHE